jgi:hypothetical protein
LGGWKPSKVGSLPPNLVIFFVSLFFAARLSFPRFPETYEVHKEKKMVKTKLKYVIPTFFTCFVQILTARTEEILVGLDRSTRVTLATEPCAKVGSLKSNTGFCPRPNGSSRHAQPLVP